MKSCFPKPYLVLRANGRVRVDLGSGPSLCEREVERSRGKIGKHEKREKGKIKTRDVSTVDSFQCLLKRKKGK